MLMLYRRIEIGINSQNNCKKQFNHRNIFIQRHYEIFIIILEDESRPILCFIFVFYCRFFYLIFKANGSYKYGCGLLETVIQTRVLPAHLSQRLIWNKCYNSYSKPDSDIALDLQVGTMCF